MAGGIAVGAAIVMLFGGDGKADESTQTDDSASSTTEPVGGRRDPGEGDAGDAESSGPGTGDQGAVLDGEYPQGRWEVSTSLMVCAATEEDGGASEVCGSPESETMMSVLEDTDDQAIAVFGVAPADTVELSFDGAQPAEPEMTTLSDGRIVYLALLEGGSVPTAVSFVNDDGSVAATAEPENDVFAD